jgi:NAD(P)-dependent dehydrogenase (short-subunit alcohol dehydrogenase family)
MAGLTDEAFAKVIDSNVRSNLWLCNLVIPGMAERRDGSVIIVSSIGGLRGSLNLGIYAISKAADFQLARNLAVEWGPRNIRVNCIAPGLVRTDFARALWEDAETLAASEARTPLRRIGEPEDIAGAAVFLASRAGRWMTGQVIVIDGGVTIS